ncbi:peptidylprolyl isomerase [Singulisphaera sp. PoT]|uniref:peptidylprolyl isomerase n=1 Tax=Singulisphaera sp. PoT TaxID=3411797 RepID=UPI003BF56715
MLTASLAPIGPVSVPTTLGFQQPLNGSGDTSNNQTFQVASSNPDIKVSVAQGKFLTLQVNHTASSTSTTDVSFAGTLTFQLFSDLTPNTVAEIESLITSGFYNSSTAGTFNRIANSFPTTSDYIFQGGSVTGTTSGNSNQPGTPFVDEFNPQLAFTGQGQLAMANSGPDSNDTQFFITSSNNWNINSYRSLDFGYTIFAQLVADPNGILPQMSKVAVDSNNKPLSPVNFVPTLSTTNANGVLHIDATKATAGEKATITVTATDPTDNTKAVQSFPVSVIANNNSTGTAVVEKPYLQQLPYPTTVINPTGSQPQVVYQQTVSQNQSDIFQIQGYAATPGDQLTYTVQGGISTDSTTGQPTFTSVQNVKSATVDQKTGVVTVVPTAGFTGTISLIVGVRDQTNRAGTTSLDSPSNYDYHRVQLTVTSSTTQVALAPIASPVTASAQAGTPTKIQLLGTSASPGISKGLTYTLLSQPTNGTISDFNPSTGTFTYTPKSNSTGTDSLQYQVTDNLGNTVLSSAASTVTITNALATTGSVRMIDNVLVITPTPRTDKGTNNIVISETTNASTQGNNTISVTINGTIDATQPLDSSVDRIVIFGAKASDTITVNSSVNSQIPVTMDGGHGGTNVLQAGAGPTREHGWFGKNTLIGGTGDNQLVGAVGRVKFRPTATTTEIFAGQGHPGYTIYKGKGDYRTTHYTPPTGTFYKFVNGKLIPSTPAASGAGTVASRTRTARAARGKA